jgi:hypothetical protein
MHLGIICASKNTPGKAKLVLTGFGFSSIMYTMKSYLWANAQQ